MFKKLIWGLALCSFMVFAQSEDPVKVESPAKSEEGQVGESTSPVGSEAGPGETPKIETPKEASAEDPDHVKEEIADTSQRIATEVQASPSSNGLLKKAKELLDVVHEIVSGKKLKSYTGICMIDDDENIDQVNVGNLYASTEAELKDLCKRIALNNFGEAGKFAVYKITESPNEFLSFEANCSYDDDPKVDLNTRKIYSKTIPGLIDDCGVLAKNAYPELSYNLVAQVKPHSYLVGKLGANCEAYLSEEEVKKLGPVEGENVPSVLERCKEKLTPALIDEKYKADIKEIVLK